MAPILHPGAEKLGTNSGHVNIDYNILSIILPAEAYARSRSMTAPFDEYERAWIAWLIYTPLEFNFSWEARILCLLPGSTTDKIAVALHNGVATDAEGLGIIDEHRQQEYEALSYTWGQPIFEESIKVNGVLFSITTNLHQALSHFRHPSRTRWLWIDALCIIKHDLVEKPDQIRNMMNIYRKAEQVLIYLGSANANTKIAMKFLQYLDNNRGNDLEIELALKVGTRSETRIEFWCKQLA
ncbi:Putative heterokaryon incompatibility [Septoria linicola]|uniref:Heterokaryon incompatibility n=1 Tax=Septoria linicola TaxID=215465 RepID=A0A9Q9B6H7_9PEZI|nr:Putative heterokaryon incompatibility [Septoria linicola]